MRTLCAFSILV